MQPKKQNPFRLSGTGFLFVGAAGQISNHFINDLIGFQKIKHINIGYNKITSIALR